MEEKHDYYTDLYFLHFFIAMLFELFYAVVVVIYIEKTTSPSGYKKCTIFNTIITVSFTAFILNPIHFECHSKMNKDFVNDHIFSLGLHYGSIPYVFCSCAYVSLILWRMSKVKPDYDGDEPYLVIYGGEGSETKKLLDDSE